MSGPTWAKVYTGTTAEQEAAFQADMVDAARYGWTPVQREQMPGSMRVTYEARASQPYPPVERPLPAGRLSPRKLSNGAIAAAALVVLVLGGLLVYGASQALRGRESLPGLPPGAGAEAPQTFTGSGMNQTATFTLRGGDYTIAWAARNPSGRGCYHGGSLRHADGESFDHLFNEMPEPAAKGIKRLHNVPAGRYYFDLSSGCDWSMTIAPE